jgi:hypothetical protein
MVPGKLPWAQLPAFRKDDGLPLSVTTTLFFARVVCCLTTKKEILLAEMDKVVTWPPAGSADDHAA